MSRTWASIATAAVMTAGTLGALAAPASADDRTGCSTGRLPSVVLGDPSLKPGQRLGVYLWHTGSGYSLRATHPGSAKTVISGRLVSTAGFGHLRRVALEKNDSITISGDGKTLSFRFANYGKIDGVDFTTACAKRVRVDAAIDGHRATTSQVKLGVHRTSPTSVPFVIARSS